MRGSRADRHLHASIAELRRAGYTAELREYAGAEHDTSNQCLAKKPEDRRIVYPTSGLEDNGARRGAGADPGSAGAADLNRSPRRGLNGGEPI